MPRTVFNDDAPTVAVSFDDTLTADEVASAAAIGMDVVELRIDRFVDAGASRIAEVRGRIVDVPVLATIRSATEGGGWGRDDRDRLALFEAVAPLVDALDVELSSTGIVDDVLAAGRVNECTTIVSFHDFQRTPPVDALTGIVERAMAAGADVVKIATMVNDPVDLRVLATLLCTTDDIDVVVIGMGAAGAVSRVAFPFLGSRLTFAAVGRPSAPGQLPLEELARQLRVLSTTWAARHPFPEPVSR